MIMDRKDILSYAAWLGGALALAGLINYSRQNELSKAVMWMLISGGVLLLAALVGNFREVAAFFSSRGGRLGTNTVVLVFSVLVILGIVNFLGYRHSQRWDWTPEKLNTLSDETKKVVGGLKRDVHVIRFDKAGGPDPLAETVAQYHRVSSHVSYQFVDPLERPGTAQQYAVRRMGEAVVTRGVRTSIAGAIAGSGAPQDFTPQSMAEITAGTVLAIGSGGATDVATVTATTGSTFTAIVPHDHPAGAAVVERDARTEHLKETDEQSLTSAILKVTQERQKSVCFVTGHGERSLTSSDGEGYSGVQRSLERENYTVKPLNLIEAKQVPAECDVIVVAGPKVGYFPDETEALKKYLDAGGKVFVLVDPAVDPKLDALFSAWNIVLGNDLALDVSGVGQIFGLGAAAPVVLHYGSHPIAEGFEGQMTFFPMARTVDTSDKKNIERPATELLRTSEQSYAKNNWDSKPKNPNFEQGKDKPGPLTLGLAEEHKADSKSARLVVIGNSAFASNAYGNLQRNGDLFANAVNWLAQDENLISIRPKSPTNRRVVLSMAQARLFYWFSLVIVPGAVLMIGVVLWWKRR